MTAVVTLGTADGRRILAARLEDVESDLSSCICVGDEIETSDEYTLRGHGTQLYDEKLIATICGVVSRVNKLITVRPLHCRYAAEVGDVVVGRVTGIVSKRWQIDLQSRQEAHLLLSAVSLPGGVQRRRTAEDELNMRGVLREGDLVSAEVQSIQHDGTVMLHTRSTKYGRLSGGQVVRVPTELVRRQRQHFQQLKCLGVGLILGCNGLLWVSGSSEGNAFGEVGAAEREAVARVAQGAVALARLGLALLSSSIEKAVDLSVLLGVKPKHMLSSGFLEALAAEEEIRRQEVLNA